MLQNLTDVSANDREPQADVPADHLDKDEGSRKEILRSSILIGGSQVMNIGFGVIRTKAMAVLLGPSGFGLFGVYGSLANLTQSIAGMGLSSSGVRQIASAVGTGDVGKVARTTYALRKVSIATGLIGAGMLFLFASPVSQLTFADHQHVAAVRILSLAIIFQVISWGQDALIQGLRRIADLAKMQIYGAALGVLSSIPIVYFYRDRGVVPALVSIALMYFIVSWSYSRRVRIERIRMSVDEILHETWPLLELGFTFMATSMITLGAGYLIRIIILREVGMTATGLYQSAWTIGGLYVGFILQALGADFFPRLAENSENDELCTRMVNEQTEIGLLLAGPGVLFTLTLAPLVIRLLYSGRFSPALHALQWICIGALLQVLTWPMSYLIIAKGKKALYLSCELAWALASVLMAWPLISRFGLTGAGIAFAASYAVYGAILVVAVNRLNGLTLTRRNRNACLVLFALIAAVVSSLNWLPGVWGLLTAILATSVISFHSIKQLHILGAWELLPRPIRRTLNYLRSF